MREHKPDEDRDQLGLWGAASTRPRRTPDDRRSGVHPIQVMAASTITLHFRARGRRELGRKQITATDRGSFRPVQAPRREGRPLTRTAILSKSQTRIAKSLGERKERDGQRRRERRVEVIRNRTEAAIQERDCRVEVPIDIRGPDLFRGADHGEGTDNRAEVGQPDQGLATAVGSECRWRSRHISTIRLPAPVVRRFGRSAPDPQPVDSWRADDRRSRDRPARVQRGRTDRAGAGRAVRLPDHARTACRTRSRSSSSTTAARTPRPTLVQVRPEAVGVARRDLAARPDRAARRQGRRGPGRHARRRRDLVVFTDADMATPPDQLPLLVEALARPRRRARLADPARRLRHARDPARLPAAAGQGVPPARLDLGGRAGEGHAVRVQGVHPRGGPGPVRPPADHQHRVRRRADLPRPAARLPDGDRADPLVRQARVADARERAAGAAGRLGPVPDPADPSRRVAGARPTARDGRRALVAAGPAALPIVAIAAAGASGRRRRWRSPATRSASTSSPTTPRPSGSCTASRSTT